MSNLFMDMQQWQQPRQTQQQYNNSAAAVATTGWPYKHNSIGSDSGSTATTLAARHTNHATAAAHNGDAAAAVTAASAEEETEQDAFENVLSLQLRKPKRWNWELSTSRSCSNIALPRILLYDHKGALLVDADSQEEQTYRPQQPHVARAATSSKATSASGSRKRASKSATANLAHSIRKALDRQFSGLQIQEATPSPSPTRTTTSATTPTTTVNSPTIDFYSNDLPDYKFQRRAHSLKGVRFKVEHDGDADADANADQASYYNGSDALLRDAQSLYNIADLPTPPSTVTTTTTATPTNSSSSGPREKRRYRRSHSSGRSPANSESILERFSYNKGRFSSPEYAVEQQLFQAPRYFLRTSNAGTLVVKEDSFGRYRRRRKARNSSTENMLQRSDESGMKNALRASDASAGSSARGIATAQRECCSAQNVTAASQPTRRKTFPVRRYRSDGNVLLQRQLSTSEEETERQQMMEKSPQQRKYAGCRRQSKKALLNIAAENALLSPQNASTMR